MKEYIGWGENYTNGRYDGKDQELDQEFERNEMVEYYVF